MVSHTNHAQADIPCVQWSDEGGINVEPYYPIDRCYWDYMRVYSTQATTLLSATPQSIPASWMILKQAIPAHVDTLDEDESGLQGFGTMLVVPGGQTLSTSFRFALPSGQVLSMDSTGRTFTYHLTIRKQPGTLAVPLILHIRLPDNVMVKSLPPGGIIQGKDIMLQTDLRVDFHADVVFGSP